MRLTMTTTLGLIDAKRLEIAQANEGQTLDVPEPAASELIKRGWAVAAPVDTTPVNLKAVPPAPDIKTSALAADFKTPPKAAQDKS